MRSDHRESTRDVYEAFLALLGAMEKLTSLPGPCT